MRRVKSKLALGGVVLVGLLAAAPALAANEGTILSLVGVGAAQPGDPIRVSSSVQAIDRILLSNLYYVVRAPSGAVVATRTRFLARLSPGETVGDSWSTGNTPETGTYRVSLCWSVGARRDCGIDFAETSFYSVPTLGIGLGVLALAMIAVWLWRRRREFARRSA